MGSALQYINSFVSSAPLWMKWATLVWIVFTFILISSMAAIKLFGVVDSNISTQKGQQATEFAKLSSHLGVALHASYALGCKEYIAGSNPNLSTIQLRLCHALSQTRDNLKSLAITRNSLFANPRKWLKPQLNTEAIANYITTDIKHVAYESNPEKLNRWLQQVNGNLETIRKVSSIAEYEKWMISTKMTLDDLIFAFGFVDWVLSHDARDKINPTDFYKFGPYMSTPFTKDELLRSALKYFIDSTGETMSYVDVIGIID